MQTMLPYLLKDADPYIACEAAYAAAYLGETAKGIERLNNPAKEADRKIGYSLLECLSLDKAMQPAIRVHLADLKDKAEKRAVVSIFVLTQSYIMPAP